jgi:8-amino-7-oxononanoate synthase
MDVHLNNSSLSVNRLHDPSSTKMPPPPESSLQEAMALLLSKRRANSSLRALSIASPNAVDFSSNDFLSLSTSASLKSAFFAELHGNPSFQIGSAGSRLLDGNSAYAEALERDIASFHNAPAGLLFNSGFDANAGFFACVPQAGDVVLYDEFIHASVHEGMRLSRAGQTLPFKHNCVLSLQRRLAELQNTDAEVGAPRRNVFVAVESLYSMDGDLAPLAEIVQVVEEVLPRGNGHVVVDEAHSTGIYGSKGRGVVCSLGLEKRVFARLHTFGKALGCNGCESTHPPFTLLDPILYITCMQVFVY